MPSELLVFGGSALHAGAPFFPVAQMHLVLHDDDHLGFGDAELGTDGLEGGAVFPRHFHDAAEASIGELVFL